MKERELDEGIELPNIQKHYMRINNYLSLFVYVNETTDKITYMVMLGKYHENIYENLVEGFKTMTSILNPEKGEATIK